MNYTSGTELKGGMEHKAWRAWKCMNGVYRWKVTA